MKGMSQKSILITGVIIILAILVAGIIFVQTSQSQAEQYQVSSPDAVVRQYFTAWNDKNWPDMYATMSDGFKRIEPTAKNLTAFRDYASSQGVVGVNILGIKEMSTDGTTASVSYSVEFAYTNSAARKFDGTFTLKYRQGDVIRGWKLVHPYGPNIDTS